MSRVTNSIRQFVWYEALDYIKLSYPVYVCEMDIIYCPYIIGTLMNNNFTYEQSIQIIKSLLSRFKDNSNFSYFNFQDKYYFSLKAKYTQLSMLIYINLLPLLSFLTLDSTYCTVCERYVTEGCDKPNCPW